MLETFLQDICKSITNNKFPELISAEIPMIRNLLNDSMALSHISLEFFCQFDACLNLMNKIIVFGSPHTQELVILIGKLIQMIASNSYLPKKFSVPIRMEKGRNLEEKGTDLKVKIGKITPRLINVNPIQIWKKVSLKLKEIEPVCYGILRFFSDVDSSIKDLSLQEPQRAMALFCKNPGHVVQVFRKTLVYLNGEMISLKVIREVSDLLTKTSPELVSCFDKTMTGFILWDLVRCSIEYYREYGFYHYRIDIFDKNLVIDESLTDAKDIFKHSIKVVPVSIIGQIGTVHKMNSPASGKSFTHSNLADIRGNQRYKECEKGREFEIDEKVEKNKKKNKEGKKDFADVENYEGYINDQFQDFIREKLRTCQNNENLINSQKSEILKEFNNFMEKIDHEKILRLLEDKTFISETSNFSYF
jgi:hypothetical protein